MQNYATTRNSCHFLQANYPGLKDRLSKTGLSILAQDKHPHRTHIYMRGE